MNERLMVKIRYKFTPEELNELGLQVSLATEQLIELKSRKSEVDANLNGQIKAAEKRIHDLTRKRIEEFEERPTECLDIMDTPVPGRKRRIRLDTNEAIFEGPMSLAEKQQSMSFLMEDEPENEEPPDESPLAQ